MGVLVLEIRLSFLYVVLGSHATYVFCIAHPRHEVHRCLRDMSISQTKRVVGDLSFFPDNLWWFPAIHLGFELFIFGLVVVFST